MNNYVKTPLFLLLFIVAITLITLNLLSAKNQKTLSPMPSDTSAHLPSPKSGVKSLKDTVQKPLTDATGTYGIEIKNIKSDETYSFSEHRIFQTGSLYKLWIMAVVYQQIQSGILEEDQVLSEDISILNEKFQIASESAEQTEGKITLSVADALNKMITISDNYAALLLSLKIRLSNAALFLQKNGFYESRVGATGGSPVSTAYDISLFFEKLYRGKLANEEYTNKMIDLLKGQRLNNKLPKYLLGDMVVAHKTGELDNFTHDAGIVYAPNGNYIIVILSESNNPKDAEERIASISKNVYNYFIKH